MAQKQSQQPTRMPAGLHIESGWSDEERKKEIEKHKQKLIRQSQDRRNG